MRTPKSNNGKGCAANNKEAKQEHCGSQNYTICVVIMLPDIPTQIWVQTFNLTHSNMTHGMFCFRFEDRLLVELPRRAWEIHQEIRGRGKIAGLFGQILSWKPWPWTSQVKGTSIWSERRKWASLANCMKHGRWAVPWENSSTTARDSTGGWTPTEFTSDRVRHQTELRS